MLAQPLQEKIDFSLSSSQSTFKKLHSVKTYCRCEHLLQTTAARPPSKGVSGKCSPLMDGVSFPWILFCDTEQKNPITRKDVKKKN